MRLITYELSHTELLSATPDRLAQLGSLTEKFAKRYMGDGQSLELRNEPGKAGTIMRDIPKVMQDEFFYPSRLHVDLVRLGGVMTYLVQSHTLGFAQDETAAYPLATSLLHEYTTEGEVPDIGLLKGSVALTPGRDHDGKLFWQEFDSSVIPGDYIVAEIADRFEPMVADPAAHGMYVIRDGIIVN